jgi:adenosylmethionine-8-amino-7-oxononanoate aminotransferase
MPRWCLADTVPSPDARGAAPGETAQHVARRAAGALDAWLQEHHSTTAAFIVEPVVQCAAGIAMHDPEYLRLARALCDRYEVHLVVDEIAMGFGRTGTMFAHQQAGIRPDFICLSKGSTGTLPLSAVLTTDAVYGVLRRRCGARLSAFALVHRQPAGLPRRAGHAGTV